MLPHDSDDGETGLRTPSGEDEDEDEDAGEEEDEEEEDAGEEEDAEEEEDDVAGVDWGDWLMRVVEQEDDKTMTAMCSTPTSHETSLAIAGRVMWRRRRRRRDEHGRCLNLFTLYSILFALIISCKLN